MKGSLRTRIVTIILLMTIAVQLAMYAILSKSNQEFLETRKTSVAKRVAEVVPTVFLSEFHLLDLQLLQITTELSNLVRADSNVSESQLITLLEKHNSRLLDTGNRHIVLWNAMGSLLYAGEGVVEKAPSLNVRPAVGNIVHSGYFVQKNSFLLVTSRVESGAVPYFLSVASSVDKNVLPSIEKFAQVRASAVQLQDDIEPVGSDYLGIDGFPAAAIRWAYRDTNELDKLIGSQRTRLQMLLALSLVIVLVLGMALARELTKPLRLLVDATRKIKNGDYSVKVPLLHRDEIGELAETIDLMRQNVGEREDEILKLAYADTLTDLPNRTLFDERLNSTVAIGARKGDSFAVLMLDLDRDYAFYNPNCEEHQEKHLSLLSEIKRAVELDELQLFYQPKVTLDDSAALSVETLLRWQHPSHGLIPPDEFLPFAEQTGAIRLITRWVIVNAMNQARKWADQGLMIKMSINISARDLLDPDFSSFVENRLSLAGVDAALICVEITESALMEDPAKARRTVEALHNLGLSISIDDYGTGYSSLAYVKNLPVNELKIDREFIMNMTESAEDVAIVRSTIELGHNLGLKVVAEGIEHEQEMQMLKEFGCDQAQGFLISKALTAKDIETWISENRNSTAGQHNSTSVNYKKAS